MTERNHHVSTNPTDGPIHDYFELTYADHLVKNRTLLQSMPTEWQKQFVALLRQFDDAFEHVDKPDGYRVISGKWMQLHDMTESQLNAARFAVEGDDEDGPSEDTRYYREFDGTELNGSDYGFVPGRDPIPHYRHAYIEPKLCARCKGSGVDPEHTATEDHGDVTRELATPCSACQLDAGERAA